MISKSDLRVVDEYESFGERRYRICIKGTNIFINVNSTNVEEALEKAIEILRQTGLDEESLGKLRRIIGDKALCMP